MNHQSTGPLQDGKQAEAFLRESLRKLEGDVRRTALLALKSFHDLQIVEACLFPSLAGLQRPSWGSWNGLLQSMKKARRLATRQATKEERERIESASTLNQVLTRLDATVAPEWIQRLQPLAAFTRGTIRQKTTLSQILALPISIRNRLAHDAPTDPQWFLDAARSLRAVEFLIQETQPFYRPPEDRSYPSPWFVKKDGNIFAFNGIDRDGTLHYVSEDGSRFDDETHTHELLQCLQQLMGKTDIQEDNFQKLLGKLAPEEIRGVTLGDHLVGPKVGEGGFATVHRGRQLSTQRLVAIKILRDGFSEDVQSRFQQEAAYLSRLDHPHIVSVISYGQETWSVPRSINLSQEDWFKETFRNSSPIKSFIVMEWIEGEPLDNFVRNHDNQDPVGISRWFSQASSALASVHAANLIHRDIKPGNLMVTSPTELDPGGDVQLMDFGIARSHHEARTLVTEAGTVFGTPAYMSPEQIRSAQAEGDVGPSTDIYSLTATFYEVYTGHRCFGHDTATLEVVTTKKLGGIRPERPRSLGRKLPWEIETILMGGLEAESRDRYSSMVDLDRDIQHYLHHEPIEYRRPSLLRRMRLAYRRNREVTLLAATFAVILILGLVAYVSQIKSEQRKTAQERDEKDRQRRIASVRLSESLLRQGDIPLAVSMLGNEIGTSSVIEPEQERWFRYWYPALTDVGEGMEGQLGAIAFRFRGQLYLRQDNRAPRLLPDPNARLFAVDEEENRLVLVSDAAHVTILALDSLEVLHRYEIDRHEVQQITFPKDEAKVIFLAKLLEYAGSTPITHVLRIPYGKEPEKEPEEEISYYDIPESGQEMTPWPLFFPGIMDEAAMWSNTQKVGASGAHWVAGQQFRADAFAPKEPVSKSPDLSTIAIWGSDETYPLETGELEELWQGQTIIASGQWNNRDYVVALDSFGRFPDRYIWRIQDDKVATGAIALQTIDGESPPPTFQGRFMFQPILTHHGGGAPFALIDLETFRPLTPDRVPTWIPTKIEGPPVFEEEMGRPPLSGTAAINSNGAYLALLGDEGDVWIYEINIGNSSLTRRLTLNEGSFIQGRLNTDADERIQPPIALAFTTETDLLVGLKDGAIIAVHVGTGEIKWRGHVNLTGPIAELIPLPGHGACAVRSTREICIIDSSCGILLANSYLAAGEEIEIGRVGIHENGSLLVWTTDRSLRKRRPPLPAAQMHEVLSILPRKTGFGGNDGTEAIRNLLELYRLGR